MCVRLSPFQVIVTTRIISCLVGDSYKPSFTTITGKGDSLYIYTYISYSSFSNFPYAWACHVFSIHDPSSPRQATRPANHPGGHPVTVTNEGLGQLVFKSAIFQLQGQISRKYFIMLLVVYSKTTPFSFVKHKQLSNSTTPPLV